MAGRGLILYFGSYWRNTFAFGCVSIKYALSGNVLRLTLNRRWPFGKSSVAIEEENKLKRRKRLVKCKNKDLILNSRTKVAAKV